MRFVHASQVFLAGCLLASNLPAGATLEAYARNGTLPVYTVKQGTKIPREPGDQTNNFKENDKVLLLSGKGLTSLDGISRLQVTVDGRATPLATVQGLHLFLNENEIRRLPAEFFTLQNVAWIYLNYNRLDTIPPGIANMKGLQGLYVTGNNISAIPPEVFTMTQLKKLQVSNNHLTEVPAAIGALTLLMHLNLSSNAIEVLPDGIARLTNLRVCDFSDNRIKRLPEGFGRVPIVHQLRVCNNPLKSLPSGFEQMPGSIDITGTQISLDSLSPALRSRIGREKRNVKTKPVY